MRLDDLARMTNALDVVFALLLAPVHAEGMDAHVQRRSAAKSEASVDARDFLTAMEADPSFAEPTRNHNCR